MANNKPHMACAQRKQRQNITDTARHHTNVIHKKVDLTMYSSRSAVHAAPHANLVIRTKNPAIESRRRPSTRLTKTHSIDLRRPKICTSSHADITLPPQKSMVPAGVRAAQINAMARGIKGGMKGHIVHTNRPNDFLHHDIMVAGMDIAMPKDHPYLSVRDTAKRQLTTNADRVNDFAQIVSLLRNKPTIACDYEKTFIEHGYGFDMRTYAYNGLYEAGQNTQLLGFANKKSEIVGKKYYQNVPPLVRQSLGFANQPPPNFHLTTGKSTKPDPNQPIYFLPDSPIYPTTLAYDIAVPYLDSATINSAGFPPIKQYHGAGAAAISDRTNVATRMAGTRLLMGQIDSYADLDEFISNDNMRLLEEMITQGSISDIFSTLLSEEHASLASAKTLKAMQADGIDPNALSSKFLHLSAHNYESIAPSSDETFIDNLFNTSGAVWGAHTFLKNRDNETEREVEEGAKVQNAVSAELQRIFDRHGIQPLRTLSMGEWKKNTADTQSKDSMYLSNPY